MSKRFVNVNVALSGLLWLVLLMWQLTVPAFAQGQPQAALAGKNILVLHAFESSMPVNEVTDRGLRASLDSGGVNIRNQFFEYLDLARNPGPEHRKLMADLMRLRYGQRKIDMIIALYAEALQFVLAEGRDIFPDVPILTLYMSPGVELPKTNRRLIDHQVSYDMVGTLEIALKLVPGAKRVYVVGGVHYSEKKLQNQARRDFQKWEGQLEFRYLSDMPLEDVLTTASSAPPGTIIFFLSMLVDSAGKTYTSRDVVHQVSRISPAPVFGLYDILLGYGIAGGSIASYERNGTRAGQLVLDILRGTKAPADVPAVLDVPPVPMFDWRQLRHWNLNVDALPKGSIIINREFTPWDVRYYIIGALAFCLAETGLIIIMIAQRRRKKLAEEDLLRKTEELDQFFNISLDLLCVANTEGYFVRLNPVWEKVFGYSRDELMSKRFTEFVHPDDVRSTIEAIAALASQKAVTYFMNRYRCKDGTYRWLEWSAAPAGSLIYAAARDITQRKLAEQALEDRLRFERLVSDLSARFVNIPPGQVDSEINRALQQLLEFFQVDRCGLLRTLPGKSTYQITHVAMSEDVPPVPAGTELPIAINPWAYEKLILKREVVAYSRLDDLPPEANVDKQTWAGWGIRSGVSIPILIGEPVDHFISINSVKSERVWPEELIPRLRLLGEILVNALERKQAEEAVRESERLLGRNKSDLRSLAGRLINAQEEERSRLARELHDDFAQRLAVFAIEVGKLEQQLMDQPAPVQEELLEMKKDIVKISQDLHGLSRQLHPSILDDLGLIKAVESECTNVSRREGVDIVFNHENISTVIPKDVSLSLYRIVQEGLRNISKHACADHISVSLRGIGHDVLLTVRDDGIGFDSAEVREKPGLGLLSMRERVSLIQGEFSIKSQPEKGTLITVRVPLTREGE